MVNRPERGQLLQAAGPPIRYAAVGCIPPCFRVPGTRLLACDDRHQGLALAMSSCSTISEYRISPSLLILRLIVAPHTAATRDSDDNIHMCSNCEACFQSQFQNRLNVPIVAAHVNLRALVPPQADCHCRLRRHVKPASGGGMRSTAIDGGITPSRGRSSASGSWFKHGQIPIEPW
jgi:hypothetical protein